MILKCKCQKCQHSGTCNLSLEELYEKVDKIMCSNCKSKDISIHYGNTLIYSYKSKQYCKKCNHIILKFSAKNLCLFCAQEANSLKNKNFTKKHKQKYSYSQTRKKNTPTIKPKKLNMDESYFPDNPNKNLYMTDYNSPEKFYGPFKKYGSSAIFHKKKRWKGYIDW